MTSPDPMAQAIAAWKQATQTYLETWQRAFEQTMAVPGVEQAADETQKTALGTRATLNEMSRRVFEPMVELSGGVPLTDFRRLADEVHTLLLRLDRIDDRLAAIEAALPPPAPKGGSSRKRKTA